MKWNQPRIPTSSNGSNGDGQQVLHHAEGADASQVDQVLTSAGDGHADQHQQRITSARMTLQAADQGAAIAALPIQAAFQ